MEYLTLVKMFPSPIGELHFSITTHNIEDYWNNLFPSPIGELHFSMCYYFSLCYLLLVSVPYRGATFLNSATLTFKCSRFIVSVPYRGATFLNILLVVSVSCLYLFPSPIGELHFSIVITKKLGVGTLGKGFRPLSGSYISQ